MLIDVFYPPDGPGTPFVGSSLLVIDTLRVILIMLSLLCVAFIIVAMTRIKVTGQGMRMFSMSVFALTIAGLQAARLGHYANWLLFASIIAVVTSVWGMWSFIRWEVPGQIDSTAWRGSRKDSR